VIQPPAVRYAGFIVVAEGIVALVTAVVLAVLATGGTDKHADGFNAYGTSAWFTIMGLGVLAGGWALVTDRRWGAASRCSSTCCCCRWRGTCSARIRWSTACWWPRSR